MEDASPTAAASIGGDWRSQIDPMARQVMIKQIFKTLRWHLPTDEEGRSRLQKIAVGFECKFHTEATSKDSYKRKIAMLLIYVKNMNQNSHRQGNVADDKGKAPMPASPGDEIIPQEFWDSVLYATGNEDPTYESMDECATNLKKRKFDCALGVDNQFETASWSMMMSDIDDNNVCSSSLAIPGESLAVRPSRVNQLQLQGWVDDDE